MDIDDDGLTLLGTKTLDMAGNTIDNVGLLEFSYTGQQITDNVNGMRFILPDSTDTFDFRILNRTHLSIEEFFANWFSTVQQYGSRSNPASPAAGDVYIFAKAGLGGVTSLHQRQSDGTITDLAAAATTNGNEGESQTPWLTNIDADGHDLLDVSRINFETSFTAGHSIIPRDDAFRFVTGRTSDILEFWFGPSTSPFVRIQQANALVTIRTQNNSIQTPILELIQNSNNPFNGRAIAQIKMIAENSGNVDKTYAAIFANSENTTSGSEEGKIMMGVMSGGNLVSGISIEGSTGDSFRDAKIGFFGISPKVQQQLNASPTTTAISTALRNLGLTRL